MLRHNHWGGIDGWVPLQNIGARAGGPQDWCRPTPDTVCRNGAQTCQAGWIHYSLLQCYYLPVAAIRGPRLKLLFRIFCVTKFTQNFLWRHLKENDMFKILAACHSGAPFQPGALRTCVPCLMVNPALLSCDWNEKDQDLIVLFKSLTNIIRCYTTVLVHYMQFRNYEVIFWLRCSPLRHPALR